MGSGDGEGEVGRHLLRAAALGALAGAAGRKLPGSTLVGVRVTMVSMCSWVSAFLNNPSFKSLLAFISVF